jgi:hypothetical protein
MSRIAQSLQGDHALGWRQRNEENGSVGQLTQAAIDGLRFGRGESWGPLWAVADLITRGKNANHQSGLAEVDAEPVTPEEARLLEELVVSALKRHPGLNARYRMIYILDRVGIDMNLLDLLRSELESALGTMSETGALLYQCLVALEHLGENALYVAGRDGYSYDDIGFNVERAREYLKRQGILFPF